MPPLHLRLSGTNTSWDLGMCGYVPDGDIMINDTIHYLNGNSKNHTFNVLHSGLCIRYIYSFMRGTWNITFWLIPRYIQHYNHPDSKFHRSTWGPSGADRTQVRPMLAPWTLLCGHCLLWLKPVCLITVSWIRNVCWYKFCVVQGSYWIIDPRVSFSGGSSGLQDIGIPLWCPWELHQSKQNTSCKT